MWYTHYLMADKCIVAGGYCEGAQLVDNLNSAVLQLCSELRHEAVALVEALAPPDFILNSVIARSDGKVWKCLFSFVKFNYLVNCF